MTDEEIVMAMNRRFNETFTPFQSPPDQWVVSREELEAYERWIPSIGRLNLTRTGGKGPVFHGVELVSL